METKETQMIRIAGADLSGNVTVYAGLTKIKGISWSFSSAICKVLKIGKERKINSLSEAEINKILDFIKNPSLPDWLLNRRKDIETGQNHHLITTDLDLKREFDIRRLKKMRCYKGARHSAGQPVRGQRTKSHFRAKAGGRTKGVKKPSVSGKT